MHKLKTYDDLRSRLIRALDYPYWQCSSYVVLSDEGPSLKTFDFAFYIGGHTNYLYLNFELID